MARRWLIGSTVIALGGLLSLAAAEGSLCLAKRWSLVRGATPAPTAYDPEIGWILVGPHRQAHVSSDFDVTVRIDRHGRRVPAVQGSPQSAAAIVFLGDSTTFGWGVEAEEAFPELVGAALGQRVANLAVPGYGVDQSVALFERQGLAERPSRVVLTLSENDLSETSAAVSYGRTKMHSSAVATGLAVSPARDRDWGWAERSSLWTALRARWGSWSADLQPSREQQLELVVAWVDRARLACRSRGAELVVIDWDVISEQVAERWSAERLAFVRVSPLLRDLQASGVRPVFADDPHWVAETHRVIAREIIALLRPTRGAGGALLF